MPSLIETPAEILDRKEKTMLVVNKARQAHAKYPGHFVPVPDFYPPTQIFIREGRDVHSVIDRFLQRYTMREPAGVKILEQAITEVV